MHFNIIIPPTPASSEWTLSLAFPHQNPEYTYPLPHTCHTPRASHYSITRLKFGEHFHKFVILVLEFIEGGCAHVFSTKQNNRTFKQRHRVREKTLGKDLSLPPNMICHVLLGKTSS